MFSFHNLFDHVDAAFTALGSSDVYSDTDRGVVIFRNLSPNQIGALLSVTLPAADLPAANIEPAGSDILANTLASITPEPEPYPEPAPSISTDPSQDQTAQVAYGGGPDPIVQAATLTAGSAYQGAWGTVDAPKPTATPDAPQASGEMVVDGEVRADQIHPQ